MLIKILIAIRVFSNLIKCATNVLCVTNYIPNCCGTEIGWVIFKIYALPATLHAIKQETKFIESKKDVNFSQTQINELNNIAYNSAKQKIESLHEIKIFENLDEKFKELKMFWLNYLFCFKYNRFVVNKEALTISEYYILIKNDNQKKLCDHLASLFYAANPLDSRVYCDRLFFSYIGDLLYEDNIEFQGKSLSMKLQYFGITDHRSFLVDLEEFYQKTKLLLQKWQNHSTIYIVRRFEFYKKMVEIIDRPILKKLLAPRKAKNTLTTVHKYLFKKIKALVDFSIDKMSYGPLNLNENLQKRCINIKIITITKFDHCKFFKMIDKIHFNNQNEVSEEIKNEIINLIKHLLSESVSHLLEAENSFIHYMLQNHCHFSTIKNEYLLTPVNRIEFI